MIYEWILKIVIGSFAVILISVASVIGVLMAFFLIAFCMDVYEARKFRK